MPFGSESGRPPSGAAYAPPGTGMRMGTAVGHRGSLTGTGRLRTGQVPSTPSREAAQGLALAQEVAVDARPVTQQGMSGMRASTATGARMVQDSSYFLGVLRHKINDITQETRSLRAEEERITKEGASYSGLERAHDSLLNEVRTLEGTLADYNLAMDKTRTTADPAEVAIYLGELEQRNSVAAHNLDEIFLKKQQAERDAQSIYDEIDHLYKSMEAHISSTAPNKLQEYRGLLRRNHESEQVVQAREAELEELGQKIQALEANQMGEDCREEYASMSRQIAKLGEQKDVLSRDLELVDLEPKQARERLLARVKEDQARTSEVERRIEEAKREIESFEKAASEAAFEKEDGTSGGVIDPTKIEVLQKRDAEMTEFIDSFEASKETILADQARTQQTIVALLEHISRGLEAQHTIPEGKQQMEALEEENEFKEQHLKSSEATMRRLQAEKENRMQELEKVKQLDKNLPTEIAALKENKRAMEADLIILMDLDGLRAAAGATRTKLEGLRDQYIKRRDTMQSQVAQQSRLHEQRKKELASNETARSLDALEQKMRSHETNIFSLREYIDTKSREIDFETLRAKCKRIVVQLNEQFQQEQEGFIREPTFHK